MGGPPVEPEMKRLIVQTWMAMRDTGQQPTAKKVRTSVLKKLQLEEYKRLRLPKLRTFQEEIRKAKRVIEVDLPLLREWTMSSLTEQDCDISADAMPYVIKVWRYAANTNEIFTVMQAKWVARLYRIWDDTTLLWYYSGWYSEIERNSLISGEKTNTFFPDTHIFLSDWETMTLLFTNHFKSVVMGSYLPLFRNKDGAIVEELLHYNDRHELELFNLVPDASDDYHKELFNLILELPSLDVFGFDYDDKMVYLRLYTHIIKGPTWKSLPPKQSIDLINALRYWVIEESNNVKNKPGYVQALVSGPMPSNLLSKVGYELPRIEEEKQ